MARNNFDFDFLTDKEKTKDDNLIKMSDKIISELVIQKDNYLLLYNYYHGYMSKDLYKYLEDNYGVGSATSVEFIPLIKKHIDVLINEFTSVEIHPQVVCKDPETLSSAHNELLANITYKTREVLKEKLTNIIHTANTGEPVNVDILNELKKVASESNENFISLYEIAALFIIDHILTSSKYDILLKLRNIYLDLLCVGLYYYRVIPDIDGDDVSIEDLNPLQTFTDYNPNATLRKLDTKAVVVKYMTRNDILLRYGKDLSKDDLDNLRYLLGQLHNQTGYYIKSSPELPNGYLSSNGILPYEAVVPGLYDNPNVKWSNGIYNSNILYPVYDVEWTSPSRDSDGNFTLYRYRNIRIGNSINIPIGLEEHAIRPSGNRRSCYLTVNGFYFQDRNAKPYSLVAATKSLLDKYNLLHFFRDNLIASSGGVGMLVNVNQIPSFLGENLEERLLAWRALKKVTGTAITDPSQDGNTFNDNTSNLVYDESLRPGPILAILYTIQSIEETCSSITGVFRERMNGIQLYDAVKNVLVSNKNSYIITKQYYDLMDKAVSSILQDTLDVAKRVYKNGLKGLYILGDRYREVFTALPEHFSHTDYDVTIIATSDLILLLEEVKQVAIGLLKSGKMSEDIVLEILTTKSLTKMKMLVKKAVEKYNEENNLILQLTQLLELTTKLLDDAAKEIKRLLGEIQLLDSRKFDIAEKKLLLEGKIAHEKIQSLERQHGELMRLKEQLLQLELYELRDGNRKNDEIKNI